MGLHRKLSTAEVAAAVERAFARQEGREAKLATDTPVIGELASLDIVEYELQRDTAASGLGIRVPALDKLVKDWRTATKDESAALPHWNVEPSADPVEGAALLNNLRQVFRRYIVLPKGADRLAAMGAACVDRRRRRRAFDASISGRLATALLAGTFTLAVPTANPKQLSCGTHPPLAGAGVHTS